VFSMSFQPTRAVQVISDDAVRAAEPYRKSAAALTGAFTFAKNVRCESELMPTCWKPLSTGSPKMERDAFLSGCPACAEAALRGSARKHSSNRARHLECGGHSRDERYDLRRTRFWIADYAADG